MAEAYLPLSHVRSVKLTLGDRAILRAAAQELEMTEAEIIRIAIRRFAFCDDANGLEPDTINTLRAECAGLPLGSPEYPRVQSLPGNLLSRIVADNPGLHDFDSGPHGMAKLADTE